MQNSFSYEKFQNRGTRELGKGVLYLSFLNVRGVALKFCVDAPKGLIQVTEVLAYICQHCLTALVNGF